MDPGTLSRLREYFRKDWPADGRERGCLLTLKGEVVPLRNVSPVPFEEFVQDAAGFTEMAELAATRNFDCWAHSHPVWPPRPSCKDIINHQLPVDMLIYSCCQDRFARYTVNEIIQMEKHLITGKGMADGETGHNRRIDKAVVGGDRGRRNRQLVLRKTG